MRLLFTISFLLLTFSVNAQFYWWWHCNFDPPFAGYEQQFVIDTAAHPNNIWQIGKPDKAVFDSAYTYPNAIVTDTVNPYPVSDTSVFIVKHPKSPFHSISFGVNFWYMLDIDSGEIARLEVSGDSGLTWVNVMTEDTAYDFYWPMPKPRLDTSIHQWQYFRLDMTSWQSDGYPSDISEDTFLYRFTFISDSVQTNKAGWIMDNFSFEDYPESIEELPNNNLITLYPNPSNGHIYIQKNQNRYAKPTVSIYDVRGKKVFETDNMPASGYLELSLPDGVYSLKYVAGDEYAVKRLVIIH